MILLFFIFGPESLKWSFDLRVCCFSDWKIVFQTIQTRLVKPGDFAPGDFAPGDHKGTRPKFLQSFAGPFLMSQFYSKVNLLNIPVEETFTVLVWSQRLRPSQRLHPVLFGMR